MSTPKRHHMIPETYLKNFAESDGRLTIYSKRQKKQIRPVPSEALVRGYYYSQPENGTDRSNHSIESTLFGNIETQYPQLLESIQSGEKSVDADIFIQTVLMLRARSPAFREAFELGLSGLVSERVKSIPRSEFPPPPAEYPDIWEQLVATIDPHRSLCAMAFYIKQYAVLLTKLKWTVKLAPANRSLLTSDNPVVWYQNGYGRDHPIIYEDSITKSTRAILPITKRLALVGMPSDTGDFQFVGHSGTLSERQVREINELQVACSWDSIIGQIRLPMETLHKYTQLAPKMRIVNFNPETNEYSIISTILDTLAEKHKFARRE